MKNRALGVGIGVFALIIGLTALGFAGQRTLNKPVHTLSIQFPTASGLVPGSDVFEAGAKIGTISAITPTQGASGAADDTHAVVTVQIADDSWPLHSGLSAGIRPKSLLGEKYVDLHDGPGNGPAYDAGKTLEASADSVPVELDEFINSLDPTTREAARILINDAGAGLGGRGNDLNQAIQTGRDNLQHLATTGQTLNDRDPDLDRILVGLDGVLGKISQDDQLVQMQQLIDNGQQTLNAIEAERVSFSRAFVDSATALSELNTALDSAVPNLRDALNLAPGLLGHLETETTILANQGSVITQGNLLSILQTGITHGPTASGGALEVYPDGRKLPIFRVCLASPNQPNNSCEGNGFRQPGAEPVPVSTSAGDSGTTTLLADWMGA
jgi:virulence factor Mce-like protein